MASTIKQDGMGNTFHERAVGKWVIQSSRSYVIVHDKSDGSKRTAMLDPKQYDGITKWNGYGPPPKSVVATAQIMYRCTRYLSRQRRNRGERRVARRRSRFRSTVAMASRNVACTDSLGNGSGIVILGRARHSDQSRRAIRLDKFGSDVRVRPVSASTGPRHTRLGRRVWIVPVSFEDMAQLHTVRTPRRVPSFG